MLTTRGRWAIAFALATFVGALLTGYPELFVLTAGLVAAMAVALLWVLRRPDLDIARQVKPDRARRHDVALVQLEVRNEARWPSPPSEVAEPCGRFETVHVRLPRLAFGRTATFTYRLPTAERAAYDIGPVELSRADPFGLMRTAQRRGDATRFWVHPTIHALAGVAPGTARSLEGPDRDHVPHGSVTFHALREYVIGDDLRHVHWRSSARLGELMVREHVDTSLPDTTLVVDTRRGAHLDAGFEEAMEAAGSIAVAILAAGYPLRMVTTCGRDVRGQSFGNHANQYLDALSEVEPSDGDLDQVAQELVLGRRIDTLVAVTGTVSETDLAALGALCRRARVSVLASVGTPDGTSVPAPRGSVVLQASTAVGFAGLWNQGVAR